MAAGTGLRVSGQRGDLPAVLYIPGRRQVIALTTRRGEAFLVQHTLKIWTLFVCELDDPSSKRPGKALIKGIINISDVTHVNGRSL